MAPTCKVCSSVRFFSKFGAHKLPGSRTLDTLSHIHFILGCWPMCTTHYLSCIWFVQKLKHIPSSFQQLRWSKHILSRLRSASALQVVRYGSISLLYKLLRQVAGSARKKESKPTAEMPKSCAEWPQDCFNEWDQIGVIGSTFWWMISMYSVDIDQSIDPLCTAVVIVDAPILCQGTDLHICQ